MIEDWCTEPCSLQSRLSGDSWGEAEWGPAKTGLCRFEEKTLVVATANGGSAQTDGIVYIPNAMAWQVQDRFNYDEESYEIIRRRVHRDIDGPRFQSLLVQRKA